MKKTILIPIVCLLLASSCQLSPLAVDNKMESKLKINTTGEIQINISDYNYSMLSHPFWALSFNMRNIKKNELFNSKN